MQIVFAKSLKKENNNLFNFYTNRIAFHVESCEIVKNPFKNENYFIVAKKINLEKISRFND